MPSDSVAARDTPSSTSTLCRKDGEGCAGTGPDHGPRGSGSARLSDDGDVPGMIGGGGDSGDAGSARDNGLDETTLVGMVFMVYATRPV